VNGAMLDLERIEGGFEDAVLDSQAAFRVALSALSKPGRILEVAPCPTAPQGVHPAANALLLALLDQDTRLWLSPSLRNDALAGHFRFHTGCRIAATEDSADFALVACAAELPALDAFCPGDDEHPERSTTLVLQVDVLEPAGGWRLTGPGIKDAVRLAAGLPVAAFAAQWASNHRRFPGGIDMFFACGRSLCGLPRSTRLDA